MKDLWLFFFMWETVYLKLQPYGQKTLRKKLSLKLSNKYYELLKVLERLRDMAYKLELPPSSRLHPVFHVSMLKKRIGDTSLIVEELPNFDNDGRMLLHSRVVFDYRMMTWGRSRIKVCQVLIHWQWI